MAQDRILWLTDSTGFSDKVKMSLTFSLQKQGLSISQVYFVCCREDLPEVSKYEIEKKLDGFIGLFKPKMIVCNDEGTLRALVGKRANLYLSRGSIYTYKGKHSILVIDKSANWHNIVIKLKGKDVSIPGKWILMNDLQKLARWMSGKVRQQPRFEYKVCHTYEDLIEAEDFLLACSILSEDIESHPPSATITVVGYSGLHPDGRLKTYVIPFYNPFKTQACHWTRDNELVAWNVIRNINKSPIPKFFQNGSYDASYFIKYHIHLTDYYCDVMHLFHSIWTEAPKKLNFISSILLDFCRFWKDESKGDGDDTAEHRGRFKNYEALERYWRYNGLDCYNTILNGRILSFIISKLEWALKNYSVEFSLQMGPALAMSMRGMRVDGERVKYLKEQLLVESKQALHDLRVMTDDDEFTPSKPTQVSHFIYKTLGAQMPELKGKAAKKLKKYSVDENILKLVATQHPIFEAYIEKIWDSKKPINNISKYCTKPYPNDRFYYSLGAAGTETGRFNGRKHNFNFGTNPQNVQFEMRGMCVADPGYVFYEADYKQSDAKFVAYECEDEVYMHNMNSDKDTHCLHAAYFFRPRTYEEILAGYKKKDLFYSHPVTGVRAITKKIVHGKNYDMAGFTLFMLMGRKAAIAAARVKGNSDAHFWSDSRLASFCQSLLDDFDFLYKRLKKWKQEQISLAVKNGNKLQVAFGRTRMFFGDLEKDKAAQREAIANFGQGGTAGNINRAILQLYYKQKEFSQLTNPALLHLQVHDSLLFQIKCEPFDGVHKTIEEIKQVMECGVEIHGRTLIVPTDGKLGFTWSEGMLEYKTELQLSDLLWEQEKLNYKYFKLGDQDYSNLRQYFIDLLDRSEEEINLKKVA